MRSWTFSGIHSAAITRSLFFQSLYAKNMLDIRPPIHLLTGRIPYLNSTSTLSFTTSPRLQSYEWRTSIWWMNCSIPIIALCAVKTAPNTTYLGTIWCTAIQVLMVLKWCEMRHQFFRDVTMCHWIFGTRHFQTLQCSHLEVLKYPRRMPGKRWDAIPLQTWEALRVPGGWGSQISRQSAHEGGKVVSPTHRPPLPPREHPWYSFLLETESTPGPQCDPKDYVNEKFHWRHRESNPRPSGLWRSASTNCATACSCMNTVLTYYISINVNAPLLGLQMQHFNYV